MAEDILSYVGAPSGIWVLSILAVVSGPLLVTLLLCFRRASRRPTILFAIVPFALTSLSFQLTASAFLITKALQGATSAATVATLFIPIWRSLLWGVLECAVCILVAMWFQVSWRARPVDRLTSSQSSRLSLEGLALAVGSAVAVAVLVWLCTDVLHLIVLTVDPTGARELSERFSITRASDVGVIATAISRRIVLVELLASNLTLFLFLAGMRSTEVTGSTRRWDYATLSTLVVIVLVGCGKGAFGMVREIRHLGVVATTPPKPFVRRELELRPLTEDEERRGQDEIERMNRAGLPPPPPPPPLGK